MIIPEEETVANAPEQGQPICCLRERVYQTPVRLAYDLTPYLNCVTKAGEYAFQPMFEKEIIAQIGSTASPPSWSYAHACMTRPCARARGKALRLISTTRNMPIACIYLCTLLNRIEFTSGCFRRGEIQGLRCHYFEILIVLCKIFSQLKP